MADETGKKGQGATSNTAPQTAGAENTPEPVILEEHVVAPAAKLAPIAVPPPLKEKEKPVVLAPQSPVTAPPTAPVKSASEQAASTLSGALSNVTNLLQKIKLPEQRTKKEEEPKRTYDTSLSIDPKSQVASDALQKASMAAQAITESLPSKTTSPTDDVRALHTLKDDLQHVVRDQKISLVRAVALEEEKRHHSTAIDEHIEVQARKQKNTRYGLFIAGAFFFLGALAIGAVLYVMTERTQKAATPITAAVLFSEQSVPLPVDNLAPADVRREIGNARLSAALTLGAILEIVLTKQVSIDGQTRTVPITFPDFLQTIGARAPAELARASTDKFFLGLHTVDENAPIMVIPITSYELAFAAMLEWEKNMNADLSPIFTAVSPQAVGPDGLPRMRRFEDTVMRNYDARALKDDSGTIQLFYAFPTRNILIIGESPYSFAEVLSRLRADRKL